MQTESHFRIERQNIKSDFVLEVRSCVGVDVVKGIINFHDI